MKHLLVAFLSIFLVVPAQANFSDTSSHTNQEAIEYVEQAEIVNGYDDGTYRPDKSINRAEFTKIIVGTLYELEGIQDCDSSALPFTDVDRSAWYAPYLCIAWEEDIISGYPDNTFRPGQNIAFVEAAKVIDIAFDGEEISDSPWYAPYVTNLSDFGVIPTTITRLDKAISRGEMAELIWRWEEEIQDRDSMLYEDNELVEVKADEIIFGFEADGPEDCEDGEIFDDEYAMCFLAEDFETQASIDDTFGDFTEADFTFFDDEGFGGGDAEDLIVSYSVEGKTLKKQQDGQGLSQSEQAIADNSALHRKIWNQFYQLIPNHRAKEKIVKFVLVAGRGDNEGTLAYVHQTDNDPNKWVLGINVPENFKSDSTLINPRDFYYTLIHEFFHVVSLEESNTTESSTCATYEIETGCLRPDAPMGQLVETFWKNSPHWKSFSNNPEDQEAAYDRYDQTPERYVTDYAATNPGEDISETFSHFVLKAAPTSDQVKDQKIKQMFANESLTSLRQAIRTNLAKIENKPLRERKR